MIAKDETREMGNETLLNYLLTYCFLRHFRSAGGVLMIGRQVLRRISIFCYKGPKYTTF